MIDVNKLWFKYKTASKYALRDASCNARSTGIISIVGRSGVGKSTFMSLVAGIYSARDQIVGHLDGTIKLDDRKPDELRGPEVVSWVPQQPALLDHLTVFQNVTLPLTVSGVSVVVKDDCERIMSSLDILTYKRSRPRELSGGMRTRISLARALVSQPKYLFLDEPFTNLDVASRWNIYRAMYCWRKGDGLCTIMTTHNIPEAMLLANRILLMGMRDSTTTIDLFENDPKDLESGEMEELFREARSRAPEVEHLIYSK